MASSSRNISQVCGMMDIEIWGPMHKSIGRKKKDI
jgi:hypothetical protein